jgi:hypothetical protein
VATQAIFERTFSEASSMALQLRSLVRSNGELELSLHDEAIPEPQAHEVVIRVEARRSTRRTWACSSAPPT